MPRRIQYFAYGSNMHPSRMAERIPAARCRGAACLAGWSVCYHKRGRDGSGKCTVQMTPGRVVHGVVYELSIVEKRALDAVEGLGYEEDSAHFDGYGNAYFYVAARDHMDAGLLPFDWYRDIVVAGARHHRLPADYVAMLAAGDSLPDPDQSRAALHRALLGSSL